MSTYSVYSPQQGREEAYQRLMDLSAARQKFTDEMFRRAEEERKKQEHLQLSVQREGMGSVWGTVGQGAMIGAGIGSMLPGGGTLAGGLIGAGAGFLLGTGMEMHNRKKFENEWAGRKKYDMKDAFTDTFSRAPNMGEFQGLLGGAAATAQGLAHAPQQMDSGQLAENTQLDFNNARAHAGMNGGDKNWGYLPQQPPASPAAPPAPAAFQTQPNYGYDLYGNPINPSLPGTLAGNNPWDIPGSQF